MYVHVWYFHHIIAAKLRHIKKEQTKEDTKLTEKKYKRTNVPEGYTYQGKTETQVSGEPPVNINDINMDADMDADLYRNTVNQYLGNLTLFLVNY